MHIASFQAKDRLLSGQKAEDPHSSYGLAENSGKCCTLYAHTKNKNKNRIQDDIDNSTDDRSHHTDPGEALGGNEGIHAQYDQDKKASQNIDSGIVRCVG